MPLPARGDATGLTPPIAPLWGLDREFERDADDDTPLPPAATLCKCGRVSLEFRSRRVEVFAMAIFFDANDDVLLLVFDLLAADLLAADFPPLPDDFERVDDVETECMRPRE